MSLGKNIQKLRKENQLSQEQLASKCNVTRQTISRWESDEVLPDTNNLITLSKLFDVSLDSLVFDEECEKKIETFPIKNKTWKITSILSIMMNLLLVIILIISLIPKEEPPSVTGTYKVMANDEELVTATVDEHSTYGKGYYTVEIYKDQLNLTRIVKESKIIENLFQSEIHYECKVITLNNTELEMIYYPKKGILHIETRGLGAQQTTFDLIRQ